MLKRACWGTVVLRPALGRVVGAGEVEGPEDGGQALAVDQA